MRAIQVDTLKHTHTPLLPVGFASSKYIDIHHSFREAASAYNELPNTMNACISAPIKIG